MSDFDTFNSDAESGDVEAIGGSWTGKSVASGETPERVAYPVGWGCWVYSIGDTFTSETFGPITIETEREAQIASRASRHQYVTDRRVAKSKGVK